jgi:cytochrome c5
MAKRGTAAARRLASMRRVYGKVCPVCGTEFEGIARRVYDRPTCQVKAYRQRKRQGDAGRAAS